MCKEHSDVEIIILSNFCWLYLQNFTKQETISTIRLPQFKSSPTPFRNVIHTKHVFEIKYATSYKSACNLNIYVYFVKSLSRLKIPALVGGVQKYPQHHVYKSRHDTNSRTFRVSSKPQCFYAWPVTRDNQINTKYSLKRLIIFLIYLYLSFQ